jgi:hypothetical protein
MAFPVVKAKYYYYDVIPSSVRGTMPQIGTIEKVDHRFDMEPDKKKCGLWCVPSWTPVNQWHSNNNTKRVYARVTRKKIV